jgi:hypothetical protein
MPYGDILKHSVVHSTLLLTLFLISNINGQVLSPVLDYETFEVGIQYKCFHRELSREFPLESDWGYLSGFAKYGLNPYVTFSLEGIIYNFYNRDWPEKITVFTILVLELPVVYWQFGDSVSGFRSTIMKACSLIGQNQVIITI